MSTGKEFEHLVRKTTAGPTSAPWWVRLLFHSVVAILVIFAGALAYDWLTARFLDREPVAICRLLGLFPYGVFLSAGMVCVLGGGLGLLFGAKNTGMRWLLIGALLYGAPQVYLSFGPVTECLVKAQES